MRNPRTLKKTGCSHSKTTTVFVENFKGYKCMVSTCNSCNTMTRSRLATPEELDEIEKAKKQKAIEEAKAKEGAKKGSGE